MTGTTEKRGRSRQYTDEEASGIARGCGWTPDVPYPGLANVSWPATCVGCGKPRKLTLSKIVSGHARCDHSGVGQLPIDELVRKRKEQRASYQALADEYGVSVNTIRRRLQAHDEETPKDMA